MEIVIPDLAKNRPPQTLKHDNAGPRLDARRSLADMCVQLQTRISDTGWMFDDSYKAKFLIRGFRANGSRVITAILGYVPIFVAYQRTSDMGLVFRYYAYVKDAEDGNPVLLSFYHTINDKTNEITNAWTVYLLDSKTYELDKMIPHAGTVPTPKEVRQDISDYLLQLYPAILN